ncbi:MAG: ribosome maturation factor RimP [Hydrogenophilaceae bacterium]|nr:ribosome maturation factor RimP [Hydrogenophilaceae bacterium]
MELPALLETTLSGMGYELVAWERAGRGLLRVFIDRPDGHVPQDVSPDTPAQGGITIDDCVAVSNQLTRLFAVENVDYDRLEVSSPGLDRPLTKPGDFVRFAGQMINVKLRVPQDNRRKFSGKLLGLEDNKVQLDMDGNVVALDWNNLDSVRLKPDF